MALGIVDALDLSVLAPESADSIHLQIEAMKLAFEDTYAHVADPHHMVRPAEKFLDPAYLSDRARRIRVDEARFPEFSPQRDGGTTYLAAADREGMMVSYIQSNGRGFGSGIVVPHTGIALQSRGRSFTLERQHPNRIAPGKRPFHTNIPAMAIRDGRALACFGPHG